MSSRDTSKSCAPGGDGGTAVATAGRERRGSVLARLRRVPARLRRDIRLIAMLRNWPDALRAEISGKPPAELRLRNGVVLHGIPSLDISFLFHEIYVRRVYSPPGYEVH